MRGALRCGLALLLAWAGGLVQAAPAGGDPVRGRELYAGRIALQATTTHGAPVPSLRAACVQCHRPSGLGGFEGGTAIPPIAGRYLFAPFDPDTGHFFAASARHRVRPAYDDAALGRLLRTGVTPDGQTARAPMPAYAIADTDVGDLAAYLRTLSTAAPSGVDATHVRIATITTPGVDPVRAAAMLEVLRAFEATRNRQTRQEFQRSAQTKRVNEMAMTRKFRLWSVVHWALEGDSSTWAAQLERHQAETPVFGVVAGMGVGDWSPVERFCERRRLPCVLPQIERVPDLGPQEARFFSVYFHAGLDQDAGLAIAALQRHGVRDVELWADGVSPSTLQRIDARLQAAGLARVDHARGPGQAVLSLLPPDAHLRRWQARDAAPDVLGWLPGPRWQASSQWLAGSAGASTALLVSALRPSDESAPILRRTQAWLRDAGLAELPADVAGTTLYAATVMGETLLHLDFDFTPEYALELMEHRLESMVPFGAYPRLAIGPDQRVASKGSYVGEVRSGRVAWEWQPTPAR
jgi:mono/diheme cytochrome c family protein